MSQERYSFFVASGGKKWYIGTVRKGWAAGAKDEVGYLIKEGVMRDFGEVLVSEVQGLTSSGPRWGMLTKFQFHNLFRVLRNWQAIVRHRNASDWIEGPEWL